MSTTTDSIALELATVFAAGDEEIRCSFHGIGGEHHCRVWRVHAAGDLLLPDGALVSRAEAPARLPELLHELRAETYRAGQGAWFRFSAHLDATGQMLTSEDYAHEPHAAGGGRFSPDAYRRELSVFPRDAAHIPAWLSAQLNPSSAMA